VTAELLPDPLVPADVDLRDTPVPLGLFVRLAVDQFGVNQSEAEAMVRAWAAIHRVPIDAGGDA
jgi:hypothetical protein